MRRRRAEVTLPVVVDQGEQRQLRRRRVPVVYTGTFCLTAEFGAICEPLARRMAAEQVPVAYVGELVGAVHAAVVEVVDLLAEADAHRRTRELAVDLRGQATRMLLELAKANRPAVPPLGADWEHVVLELASTVSADLSSLLTGARPPDGSGRTASERLEEALRGVDRAAVTVERRLDVLARTRAEGVGRGPAPTDDDKRRAVLAGMGIHV